MTTVTVLNRDDWGASADYPRRGYLIGPQRRTEVFIHHTVITDDDDSPNEWDSLDEVRRRMRVLQTIRPDLGRDVPYSMVAFKYSSEKLFWNRWLVSSGGIGA